MQVVFDSSTLPAAKRGEAWRQAICEIYLPVSCAAEQRNDYHGFVRETRFGAVTLTDTQSSPQSVARLSQHIASLEKDCYFVAIPQSGIVMVRQAGSLFTINAGKGAMLFANEPYNLSSPVKHRSFWVELPRQAFASRFVTAAPPLVSSFSLAGGLGRIAVEFCTALATEGSALEAEYRAKLGEQFMDLLALAVSAEPERQTADEENVRRARLRSVMAYIDTHLGDPNLSLAVIARRNGISLSYLHKLFRLTDMSASEWLRSRRLKRCYALLTSTQYATQSITEIAYSMGFSSSSHFSHLFRAEFGMRPSDVRGVTGVTNSAVHSGVGTLRLKGARSAI